MNRRDDLNHFNLLYDISELSTLLTGSENIEHFLQRTVEVVSRHLHADVCSIYLFEDRSQELVLKATVGLNPGAVGKIRMKLGEGLVGTVMERLQAIREESGSRNPRFKYFEEADEDRFESFLAVPIQRGVEKIGVIAVQHEKVDYFGEMDVMALRAIAAQLAGAIENARLLMEILRGSGKRSETDIIESLKFVKGKSAVEGYAYAPSNILGKKYGRLLIDDHDSNPGGTIDDFHYAIHKTIEQLQELQERVSQRLLESASLIFTAHFMILKDENFINKIKALIIDGMSPSEAVRSIARYYISIFSSSSHAYMQEKVIDIEDLANRILKNLRKKAGGEPTLQPGRIVIAPDLYPSDVLKLAAENVKGIILVSGGVTSHVSIIARSLQIPLIIADRPELLNLSDDTPVLMDADIGNIYVCPSEKIVRQFEDRNKAEKTIQYMMDSVTETTRTKDDTPVHLLANINLLSELRLARDLKVEGVGLYRTEFPFLIRSYFPSEEEQFVIYKHVFDEMNGKIVTIRTLDLAGDKILPYSNAPMEANPQLGLRSIRFTMHNRDIFEQQLRAILRAGADSRSVRIMFPLISSLDEFRDAKQVIMDCINQLSRLNLPHCKTPSAGILVELPSLIEIIDDVAMEADFFSIGTNDFIQYMLAVDRTNEKVSRYYQPYHPSVLRGLARVVKSILDKGKDISVCGEMAHESGYIPFLLGIGIRTLSLDPQFMPLVQQVISELTIADAESYAGELVAQSTLDGILRVMKSRGLQ
ncbi:MAG TPA: phosphoenolpyruvate--protein phosphotransferase [Deltaproteobacteria bacterium]|nr:phosphoenolpyruvate--protein phosphotransferase [Deltaproteobacteria bacterium]